MGDISLKCFQYESRIDSDRHEEPEDMTGHDVTHRNIHGVSPRSASAAESEQLYKM